MSAPVDVLAVMDAAANWMDDHPATSVTYSGDVHEARAAVAELIEAAFDVAGELTIDPEPGTPLARLDAALARVHPMTREQQAEQAGVRG